MNGKVEVTPSTIELLHFFFDYLHELQNYFRKKSYKINVIAVQYNATICIVYHIRNYTVFSHFIDKFITNGRTMSFTFGWRDPPKDFLNCFDIKCRKGTHCYGAIRRVRSYYYSLWILFVGRKGLPTVLSLWRKYFGINFSKTCSTDFIVFVST